MWGDNIVGGIGVGVEPVTRGSWVGRCRPFELVAEKLAFAFLDQVDFLLVISAPKVVVGEGAGAGAVLSLVQILSNLCTLTTRFWHNLCSASPRIMERCFRRVATAGGFLNYTLR